MTYDYARVNVSLWGDPDFRNLPPAPQHLYLALWTSPERTYCGTHDWRPSRLNGRWSGATVDAVRTVAACLQARHFLVIDEDTEEALIRSWARFDGLMRQPRMAVSLVNAYASVASQTIRAVIVSELHKIRAEEPDLACWADRRVLEVLDHPQVSAKDLPTPEDPFGGGFMGEVGGRVGLALALGLPQTQPKVCPSVCTPPTNANANTNNPLVVRGGVGGDDPDAKPTARKRASALPSDWQPNDTHRRIADEERRDLAREVTQFRDDAAVKGRTAKDWDAAFRNWLRSPYGHRLDAPRSEPTRLPHATEIETPPDGLSAADYAAWCHEQKARRTR